MCEDDTKKPIYMATSGVYMARFNPTGESNNDISEEMPFA